MKQIRNADVLKPKMLWENFDQILAIPHPSKKEQQIVKFMEAFGKSLKLETHVDEVGNLLIKKPATPGKERSIPVILQSHLDMVPQKNQDKIHDFEKDPIQAYVDGQWLKAEGTTLGADNGVGIAATMSILQSKDIEHGPIEALFTVDEETGLNGVSALKSGVLKGRYLLNLGFFSQINNKRLIRIFNLSFMQKNWSRNFLLLGKNIAEPLRCQGQSGIIGHFAPFYSVCFP